MKTYFITGGCGFIGSNFIQYLIKNKIAGKIINLDKLTYAGNRDNLSSIEENDNYFLGSNGKFIKSNETFKDSMFEWISVIIAKVVVFIF